MTESLPGVLLYSEGWKDQHCSQPSSQCYGSHKGFHNKGPETPWDLGWPFSVIPSGVKGSRLFCSGSTGYWVEAALGEPVSPVMEIPSAKGSFASKICPVKVASRSPCLLRVWL